jgi:hypothetical protein
MIFPEENLQMNLNSSNCNRGGPISSLFSKLSYEQRRILDRAILNRQLPSCRALYEHHHLANLGISYHAFWRYARRLRKDACKNLMLDPTLADQIDLSAKLPDVIGAHFLQILLHDNPNPMDVTRMANTYHQALHFRSAARGATCTPPIGIHPPLNPPSDSGAMPQDNDQESSDVDAA